MASLGNTFPNLPRAARNLDHAEETSKHGEATLKQFRNAVEAGAI